MSLQNLQLELTETLLDGDTSHTVPVRPLQNLIIYQHQIQHLLIATLHKAYPLIVKLVGNDFFQLTAKEYIKRYPSRSPNINDYGAYFSDFLAEYEPLHDLIYLVEVAQFEWVCHQVASAANHSGMNVKLLQDISEENHDHLYFTFHPASHLQRFYYPILRIIELCHSTQNETLDVDAGGVNLVILRQQDDLLFIPLSHAEFTFLDMLAEGKSLAESANTAHMIDEQFDVKAKINYWIEQHLIVEMHHLC